MDVFETRAVLADPHTIKLADRAETISAKNILVATGARPFIPEIAGAEHVITSNEALHLEELPETIAIVGGGYIALEFATIFSGLGVKVTVLYRGPQILRGFDNDIRDALAEEMSKRGVEIRCNTEVIGVTPDPVGEDKGGFVLDFKDGDSLHKHKGHVRNRAGAQHA